MCVCGIVHACVCGVVYVCVCVCVCLHVCMCVYPPPRIDSASPVKHFSEAFLLTYYTFITPDELTTRLLKR